MIFFLFKKKKDTDDITIYQFYTISKLLLY